MNKKASSLQILIIVLFHFLFLTVPFFFTWFNDELFEFPKMMLTYGFTTLIGTAWLARMIIEKRLIWKKTFMDWPIMIFFFSQLLSTIFSIHPRTSLLGYYSRFHGGLFSTVSYIVLFYALVNNLEKKHLKNLFLSIFLAAIGVSLYAIPEHFGHSPSCLMITGVFDAKCWIQDVQSRVFATFGQPNWLAAYAITLIPAGLALGIQETLRKRLYYWLGVVLLFTTLLFTQSRSGVLGLGVGLAVFSLGLPILILQSRGVKIGLVKKMTRTYAIGAKGGRAVLLAKVVTFLSALLFLFMGSKKRRSKTEIKFKPLKTLLIGLSSLIVLALIFGTPYSPSLKAMLNNSSQNAKSTNFETADLEQPVPAPVVNRLETGGTDSGEIRKIVWSGALKVWQRYPVFGSGVETFAYSYYQDRPVEHNLVSEWDFLYNKAHNEFLNFLATTGAVGLGAYLLLIGWFSVAALTYLTDKKNHLKNQALVLGLISGVAALSVSNFFGFSTVMVSILFFLYPAFFIIIKDKSAKREKAASKNSKKAKTSTNSDNLDTFQYLSLFALGFVCLLCLRGIYRHWMADVNFARGKSFIQANYATEGLQELEKAIKRSPREALFYDQLANNYAKLALGFHQAGDASNAAQLTLAAIQNNQKALELNERHLNFYKSKARVYLFLSQIDNSLLTHARDALREALELSPTDAKLVYNLGLIESELTSQEIGLALIEQAVDMKPNYEAARLELGKIYEAAGATDQAMEQYQYIYDHITRRNELVNQKLGIGIE